MRVVRAAATIFLATALCAGLAFAARVRARQAASPKKPAQGRATAPAKHGQQPFKNLQVLQQYSEEQVLDGMEYVSMALGTRCNFCHDAQDYSKDDKPEEKTARQMMKMLLAIDKDDFHGHP
jgi:hypothetical protein